MFRRIYKEKIGKYLSWSSSILAVILCLAMILYVLVKGISHISLGFITTDPIVSYEASEAGGIKSPLIGTLVITFIGILFSLPWSLATAIYLSEYSERNRFAKYFRLGIDILASVPTIVIAIFGLAIFSNPALGFFSDMVEGVQGVSRAFGRSFIACGLTMSVMVLPFMIKTFEEAIKAVPQSYREGSLALGASKWYTVTRIIVPSSINGIVTGVILGMGRIIGDTSIVWLTLGGSLTNNAIRPVLQNLWKNLKLTGSTLTSYIYFTSPAGELNLPELAFGATFILILLIVLLNLAAELMANFSRKVKS